MKIAIIYLILFFVLIVLVGCPLPTVDDPQQMIRVKSTILTLAWDPPVANPGLGATSVSKYRIYYSNHGASEWVLLDEIDSTVNPQYTVSHGTLGDGVYDFAVSAVTSSGQESSYHTSMDAAANPMTGWYAWWMKND